MVRITSSFIVVCSRGFQSGEPLLGFTIIVKKDMNSHVNVESIYNVFPTVVHCGKGLELREQTHLWSITFHLQECH